MAILKFRVFFEEDDTVYRDIVIKHNQLFFDLHQAILIAYEFDSKHQATFYRSNDNWLRGRAISLEKYDIDYKAEPLLMMETTIGSEIADPNQRFVYVYDFQKNYSQKWSANHHRANGWNGNGDSGGDGWRWFKI